MSHDSRRILTPPNSRKRKERKAFHPSTSSKLLTTPAAVSRAVTNPNPNSNPITTTSSKLAEPLSSNRLLAGYLAYEFLTKGTLLGQRYDSARPNSAELRRNGSQSQSSSEAEPSGSSKPVGYAEVANLLKSDAAHVSGVVNPTQLARWIQM